MGVELGISRLYKIAEPYDYILLGEEHFFAPHQRFAHKLAEDLDQKVGVEMIPTSFSNRTPEQQLEFIRILDKSAPLTPSGDYQCLLGKIVGLRSCPDSEKSPTLLDEYNKIREHWLHNDEGYSKMLAEQIKASGIKLHLLGNFRITKVSEYLPNCLQLPQIFKEDKQDYKLFVTSSKIYSQISF